MGKRAMQGLAGATLAGALCMVAPVQACDPAQVVQDIAAADASRYAALVAGDLAAVARYLGDELSYTHSSSVVDTKQAYLDALRSGKVVVRQVDRSDVNITPYGCVGVMTGRGDFKVTLDGKDVDVPLRFTNVWVMRDGGWQMVAWEATRIPAK
jgi:ketosteroid isomerase-like protein